MSSTDETRLGKFFDQRLAPAAKRMRERGVEFFPFGPDANATTYFRPAPAEPDFATLEESEWGPALSNRWRAEGLPELVELVDGLTKLADELAVAEEETADISPFVYVMY